MKTIPIFFAVDNSYAPFLAAALASAADNCSKERSYRAIILHEKVSEENIRRITALERDNFKIDFIPFSEGMDAITDRMSNRLRCDYFTLTIYFRLFIPEMFPEYDKALYVDSDIIVKDDLAELFDTEIGDNLVGACADVSVVDVPELAYYMEEAVGVQRDEYVNSGILVMNLEKMRKEGFTKHFLDLLTTYHFDCIAPDQDYLNAICNTKIFYLDGKWDVMPDPSKPAHPAPAIIHYNLFSKPWCYDGIQYADDFWHYAELSGYINEIRAYKEGYSEEHKKSDSDCLALLVRRGAEIPHNDITFKKIYESGVKIRL